MRCERCSWETAGSVFTSCERCGELLCAECMEKTPCDEAIDGHRPKGADEETKEPDLGDLRKLVKKMDWSKP